MISLKKIKKNKFFEIFSILTINNVYCSNQRLLQTASNTTSDTSTTGNGTNITINGTNLTGNSSCVNETTGQLIQNCTNSSNSSNSSEPQVPVFHQRIFYILPTQDKDTDLIEDILKSKKKIIIIDR
jgi:hypothetical protein